MATYSLEEKVKWFAISSRIFILCLQFILNSIIPDHNAAVFRKPFNFNLTYSSMDIILGKMLDGLSHWDSEYYLHIAEYGYTYENTLAFFPLFPFIIRQLSSLISYAFNVFFGLFLPQTNLIMQHNWLLLSAIFLNNVLFVRTAVHLYKLSLVILKNEKLSYISAILFCINPASIFFSAVYSESVYCFLVFFSMLQIELKNMFLSSITFGLSGLTRSNGILNIGFIGYSYIKLKVDGKSSYLNGVVFFISIVISTSPFFMYQIYAYLKYCLPNSTAIPTFIISYGLQNSYKFPGSNSSWCSYTVPFAYSYVQKHYWNVGFLKYYEIKQLPNFLLALPILIIVFVGCWHFLVLHKSSVVYLGLQNRCHSTTLPVSMFPYVIHCLALSIFGTFVIHVQVVTRLLFSSSPVPYWFSAWFISSNVTEPLEAFVLRRISNNSSKDTFIECYKNRVSRWRTFLFSTNHYGISFWIKLYFFTYFIVGTLMFSNNLPWT